MMNKEQLDPLRKVEELTSKANEVFSKKGKSVFERYPLLFALLVIIGATMMSQGIKELIFKISFLQGKPVTMLAVGLIILILTGSLYKKLEK